MLALVVVVSTACTLDKSAGSQGINNANARPTAEPTVSSETTGTCSLKLAQAPALNGVRLGMTQAEVLTVFPQAKDDPDVQAYVARPPSKFGVSEQLIRPSRFKTKQDANVVGAISQMSLTFLDGHASRINAGYNGPAYKHVDDFVANFVNDTNLPPAADWQPYAGLDTQLKVLRCAEFEVRVFAGGEGGNLNYVQLQDLEADKKLKERRKKAKEQASPTPGSKP